MLRWLVTQVVKEFTKRRKCRESSFYSHSNKGEGLVWRETPALRSGGFKLLLDCNWILKGWGFAVVWPLGCWETRGCNLLQCYLLPVAVRRD